MKQLLLLGLFLSCLGLASCTTDFEVLAPYREIKTSYCVLDGADSVHYLRVGKGFQNNKTDAGEIAYLYPDSSNFRMNEVDASLYATLSGVDEKLGDFIPVPTIKNKEGDFPNENQWVFKLEKKLDLKTEKFTVKILSKRSGIESVGATKVATPFTFTLPNELKNRRSPPDTLNFSYIDNKFRVQAKEETNAANRFVKFNYYVYLVEHFKNPVNGSITRQVIIPYYSIGHASNLYVGSHFQAIGFDLDYSKFIYNFRLQMPLEDDENILFRRFLVRGDLELVSCTQELLNYFDSNSAYSELTQSIATHSNISHAVGVFGSIYKKKFSVPMSIASRRRIEKDLKIYRIRL